MRPIRAVALTLVLLPMAATAAKREGPSYVDGEIIVKYRNPTQGAVAAKSLGMEVKRTMARPGVSLLKLPSMTTVPQAIAALKANPDVEYAEPNFRRFKRAAIPNDPLFGQQWGLRNTGQANFVSTGPAGTPGADLNMVEAWDANGDGTPDRTGSPTVTVAVIDDSVKIDHEDLAANIVPGHDYRDDDDDPSPEDSDDFHGTLVAGCIGAVGNNGIGVAGVAWNSKLMPLRFGFDSASEADSIQFAIDNGAKIINASFGGPGFSQTEFDAIDDANAAGIVFVAAAGNHDSNIDVAELDYPANYDLPNIVSVAATNRQDGVASFSQYGPVSVDVAAPGLQIVTTTSNGTNTYSTPSDTSFGVSGTSFASPYVAGVAALIKSQIPAASVAEIKARLIESGEPGQDAGVLTAGGRVDADKAIEMTARPSIVLKSVVVDAAGNGSLDPGETATVHVTFENLWQAATGVSVTATAATAGETPARAFTVTGPVTVGAIGQGATGTADFNVTVPADIVGHHYVRFTFAVTADGGYTASRHWQDEVASIPLDTDVSASFVGTDVALGDDFHAWDVVVPADLADQDLLITTTASPDIDLLVKYNAKPVYDIALGADPEDPDAVFCTSGTADDCDDPDTGISGFPDGNEAIRVTHAPAGTYHIVVVNFALQNTPLNYTISARRVEHQSSGGGGGGGAMGAATIAGLLGFGLLAVFARRRSQRATARIPRR